MILIAGFRGPPAGDLLPEQGIERALRQLTATRRDITVRVEPVPQRVIQTQSDAIAWGKAHAAQMVIWGSYDAGRVQVEVEQLGAASFVAANAPAPVPRMGSAWHTGQEVTDRTELFSLVVLGWLAYFDGKLDAADALWRDAVVRASASAVVEPANLGLDQVWYMRGVVAESRADVAAAREAYEQALLVNPQDPFATLGIARISYNEGDYAGALAAAEAVTGATPAAPPALACGAWEISALTYAYSNRLDEAIQAAQHGVAIAPDDLYRRHLLSTAGVVYLMAEKWDQAAEASRKSIALGIDDLWTYLNLGRASLHLGKMAEAEQAYRDAVAKARVLHDEGTLDEGLDELRGICPASPS